MDIGNKIKKIRLKKGLRQSDLAADVITRNMLSQIESGKATPSLATLAHISSLLDVPIEYLVSEEDDIFSFEKKEIISRIKSAFAQKKYQGCITLCEKYLSSTDDETSLILAHSYIECAKRSVSDGNLETAGRHVKKALEHARLTIYPTNDIEAVAALLSAIADNVQSPKLEFNESTFMNNLNDAASFDLYCYITERRSHKFSDQIMADHLHAKELMKTFHYTDAMEIMSKIEENKSQLRIGATILFNLYCDMEYCCKELRDFEGAYKYSSKRIALLSAFKS